MSSSSGIGLRAGVFPWAVQLRTKSCRAAFPLTPKPKFLVIIWSPVLPQLAYSVQEFAHELLRCFPNTLVQAGHRGGAPFIVAFYPWAARCTERFYGNKNSFVLNSLIVYRNFAAFSNSTCSPLRQPIRDRAEMDSLPRSRPTSGQPAGLPSANIRRMPPSRQPR